MAVGTSGSSLDLDTDITVIAPTAAASPVSPSNSNIPKSELLTDITALARFEFEPYKGNDGTKIIMVEWQDGDESRDKDGTWQVYWSGKSSRTTLKADDEAVDGVRRLYFLLGPGVAVPSLISIAYEMPRSNSTTQTTAAEANTAQAQKGGNTLRMNVQPLPAIFTPELGATAKASGKKGVLHTIWAKKRLQVLDKEIKREQEMNIEGVALDMAVAEKEWIERDLGVTLSVQAPPKLDMSNISASTNYPSSPPLSPRSPGGNRRLTDKLKGLSITTSDKDLMAEHNQRGVNTPTREEHPLSPETGDMAYSSFSAFRDRPPSSAQPPKPAPARKIISQAPPAHILQQQQQGGSLNFMGAVPTPPSSASARPTNTRQLTSTGEEDDDLFAVAMSPRQADDPKSPFSMSSQDVGAFAKIKGELR